MKLVCYILVVTLLLGCSSNKAYTDQEDQAYLHLKEVVQSKKLEIHSSFARPMATSSFMQVANTGVLGSGNTATSIDISNNSNMFRILGDSISGYFPYYGEQQFGGGYPGANHQGIEFHDIPEDYVVSENDAKHFVQIQFKIDDEYRHNERYNVFITLFPNNRSSIQINSTNRTTIEYSGTLKSLMEDKTRS
ncbi:MAG: DUF4251 domain-containing protein [Gelidibacter sp.]